MATTAGPRKTLLYLSVSVLSMFAGSAFVQAIVHTNMDLTKEIEAVRETRRIQRGWEKESSSGGGEQNPSSAK